MVKMSVIYKAPPGDSKVTEAFGHTFYDGKAEEIEVDEETAERIKSNPVFQPGGHEPVKPEAKPQPDDDDEPHGRKHR